MRLATVILDSEDETVTLVWGGFQPTALPYSADQLEQVRAVIAS